MMQLSRINQFYGESHTLWDIDLNIEQGKCMCVMGRNGMGKTTLLKVIMGMLPVASGQIYFNDVALTKRPIHERARSGIGYVPQGRMIFPSLTVEENLRTGLYAKGRQSKIPSMVFELFPVLEEMKNRLGGDLSGGQQQQLAIGRALCLQPTMLILDEPTEGIQPNIVQEISEIIAKLNQQKLTVLLVEQKLRFAKKVGHQFAIMDKGRFVAQGDMDALDDQLVKKHLTV